MPYVSVEVDPEDILSDLSDKEVLQIMQRRLPRQGVAMPEGFGEGDASMDSYVERAFLAAKRMANVPREIADLFWHVHGRAI